MEIVLVKDGFAMDFLNVILTSVGSVIALFILTKIMGNKQMSQLSMFDYIVGISIGSIAAEMATELEEMHKALRFSGECQYALKGPTASRRVHRIRMKLIF